MAGPLLLLGLLACVFVPASIGSSAPIVVVSEVCYYPVDLDRIERQLKEDNVSVSIMRTEGKLNTFLNIFGQELKLKLESFLRISFANSTKRMRV